MSDTGGIHGPHKRACLQSFRRSRVVGNWESSRREGEISELQVTRPVSLPRRCPAACAYAKLTTLAPGAIWPHGRLGRNAQAAAFWTALYSAYANWLFTTLAAIFGTGALSPITASGFRAQAWQESPVTAGLMSVGIVVVTSTLIFLWGLRGKASQP
jgi:hypothetical protein